MHDPLRPPTQLPEVGPKGRCLHHPVGRTSREEFKALYYEVYKLHRLPGSPLGEPEWIEELTAEVVSTLEDHLGQKGGKPPQMMEEPGPTNVQAPMSKTPRRGRRTPPQKGALLR